MPEKLLENCRRLEDDELDFENSLLNLDRTVRSGNPVPEFASDALVCFCCFSSTLMPSLLVPEFASDASVRRRGIVCEFRHQQQLISSDAAHLP